MARRRGHRGQPKSPVKAWVGPGEADFGAECQRVFRPSALAGPETPMRELAALNAPARMLKRLGFRLDEPMFG